MKAAERIWKKNPFADSDDKPDTKKKTSIFALSSTEQNKNSSRRH